jgi:hypothetical protein
VYRRALFEGAVSGPKRPAINISVHAIVLVLGRGSDGWHRICANEGEI